MTQEEVQYFIAIECNQLRELLLAKNREYGNSALDPLRIFASSDPVEQIKVRIDDKLSRLKNAAKGQVQTIKEDTVADLLGYLILLKVAMRFAPLDKAIEQ